MLALTSPISGGRSVGIVRWRTKPRREGKEQYRVEISNRFAALENLDAKADINRAWVTIRENIKISAKESFGYYELKKIKPWFDEGYS
jgi:hypothetical protein